MIKKLCMMNIAKAIASTTPRQVKTAKIIVGILALLLIIADGYFAFAEEKGFPTFSKLFKDSQGRLLWFTFLFGCLTGKIFYNRFTPKVKNERTGVLNLLYVVIGLVAIGNTGLFSYISVWVEFFLFIGGIVCAHYFWPQYQRGVKETKKDMFAKDSTL
jgi:hypothetical protein